MLKLILKNIIKRKGNAANEKYIIQFESITLSINDVNKVHRKLSLNEFICFKIFLQ